MKVLYICEEYENYGSMRSLIQMLEGMIMDNKIIPYFVVKKRGYFYNWATNRGFKVLVTNYYPFLIDIGSDVIYWPIHYLFQPVRFFRYCIFNNISKNKIIKFIEQEKIEIIHTNLDRYDLGAMVSKQTGIPHLLHLREYPSGYHFNMLTIRKGYANYLNRYTSTFIAISNDVRDKWIKNGLEPQKCTYIWDGVEFNKDNYVKHTNNDVYKIVMTGSLSKEKGQDQLIKTINELPLNIRKKIIVDIYGEGSKKYFNYLSRLIDQFNLENTVFLKGYKKDIVDSLIEYDLGIVCSKCEGLGRSSIEFMYSGCLVIASDTGANQEIIKNNETGLIYKYGDIEDLKNKIVFAFNEKEIGQQITLNAQKFAIEHFNIFNYSKKILNVYSDSFERL